MAISPQNRITLLAFRSMLQSAVESGWGDYQVTGNVAPEVSDYANITSPTPWAGASNILVWPSDKLEEAWAAWRSSFSGEVPLEVGSVSDALVMVSRALATPEVAIADESRWPWILAGALGLVVGFYAFRPTAEERVMQGLRRRMKRRR